MDKVARNALAPLLLRLGLAVVFIFHGMGKVSPDKSWGTAWHPELSVPLQTAVAWGEFLGGLALASGSAGNASLVEADDFGLLLDAGLGPRVLASRLADAGASWSSVHAVVITHTHSDHWDDATLTQLWKRRIPLHCHASHRPSLLA